MAEKLSFPFVVRPEYIQDGIARPFLPVRIRYRHNDIQTMALLDSGSDINVLPYQLGLSLGADWDSQGSEEELQGIGGGIEAKRIVADLYVGAWPSIRQVFAWAQDDDIPVILGQWNFFQMVDVCFHRSRSFFEVDMSPQS